MDAVLPRVAALPPGRLVEIAPIESIHQLETAVALDPSDDVVGRGVTVRTALSRRRRSARRRETVLETTLASVNDPDPSDGIALGDALRRLPDSLRQIFVLKFVEGFSHAEIAELLDIRPGTSAVRLFRAIRSLRSLLSDYR